MILNIGQPNAEGWALGTQGTAPQRVFFGSHPSANGLKGVLFPMEGHRSAQPDGYESVFTAELVLHQYVGPHDAEGVEAHVGVIMATHAHQMPPLIPELDAARLKYKGVGMIVGKVWDDPNSRPPYITGRGWCARQEEWTGQPFTSFEYLRYNSHSPAWNDGMSTKIMVGRKNLNGEMFHRYAYTALNGFGQYVQQFDTGDVQSNAWEVDRWSEALMFFTFSACKAHTLIELNNPQWFQRRADTLVPDLRFMPRISGRP